MAPNRKKVKVTVYLEPRIDDLLREEHAKARRTYSSIVEEMAIRRYPQLSRPEKAASAST